MEMKSRTSVSSYCWVVRALCAGLSPTGSSSSIHGIGWCKKRHPNIESLKWSLRKAATDFPVDVLHNSIERSYAIGNQPPFSDFWFPITNSAWMYVVCHAKLNHLHSITSYSLERSEPTITHCFHVAVICNVVIKTVVAQNVVFGVGSILHNNGQLMYHIFLWLFYQTDQLAKFLIPKLWSSNVFYNY